MEKSRAYGRGLLRGVAKYSRLHSPWAFYEEPLPYLNAGGSNTRSNLLKDLGIDGLVIRETEKSSRIIEMDLPVILTDIRKNFSITPVVKTNDLEIGKMAAEYLLNRGFRQFAFCGFDSLFWSQDRREGFAGTIKNTGFDVHFYEQPKSSAGRLLAKELIVVTKWLESLPKPVALMACNDDRARHVIEACKIAGLHVPEQVAVLGVDNDELVCDLSSPRLSSVNLNFERGGYEAAELLDRLMAGEEKMAGQKIIVQPTHVVTRQSTDILAIEDREVARAVRYIRQHAREMIQVSDVANTLAVSRRSLERRFRKVLKRSVFDEIKNVRLEQVCRMLVETNQPIGRIASALNYPGIEHISRFFRHEKGMSPLAYRKKYGGK